MHENGLTLVETELDFVMLGEGRNFTLEMVQRAVDMILGGAKFITTNCDPLSGITKKEELNNYAFKPDLVVGSVKDIKFPLKMVDN